MVELQVMMLLSPKGGLSFPAFILCMDAGSSNFAVDAFNEVVVGLAEWTSVLNQWTTLLASMWA